MRYSEWELFISFVIISIWENEVLPPSWNMFSRFHPLWVSSYFNLLYPCASPAPDVASPGPGPLTSSQSMFSLCHLIWSLAMNATFELMTPKFTFSALTSPLNSCHFYPSTYWTPSLPFLILIYILMCPKPNFSFSLLSQSSPSVNGLPHSFSCSGPKPWYNP